MASHNQVKVAVLGASGYSGIEAVRILAGHPFVELSVLTSEHYAGREVADVYRHLAGHRSAAVRGVAPRSHQGPRRGRHVVPAGAGRRGADRRIRPRRRQGYRSLRRLPSEGSRRSIARPTAPIIRRPRCSRRRCTDSASSIAMNCARRGSSRMPGCFPTGALLGILPLIRRDLIDPSSIVIDCQVGHHRCAAAAAVEQLFAEVNENFRAYKVGNHRHVPEMEQEIGTALGREVAILFVPHLLPVTRGILTLDFHAPARRHHRAGRARGVRGELREVALRAAAQAGRIAGAEKRPRDQLLRTRLRARSPFADAAAC